MAVAILKCNNAESRQQALDATGPIQESPKHGAQRVINEIYRLRISCRQIELYAFNDETQHAPDEDGQKNRATHWPRQREISAKEKSQRHEARYINQAILPESPVPPPLFPEWLQEWRIENQIIIWN